MTLKCKPAISLGEEVMKQLSIGDMRLGSIGLGEKEGLPLCGRWVIFYT